jgi:Glycosyltransferase like family 2
MKGSVTTTLTIVVDFWKNVDYLRRAIESVLAQPQSQWTLVVFDSSVDEQEHDAAKALLAGYPTTQLRYVRNDPSLSLGEKCNRRLDLAETDLVAIVHGDDEVLPCFAQECLDLAMRHPEATVLFTAVQIIDKDSRPCFSFVDWFKRFLMPKGREDFVLADERSLRSILRGNWINGSAVCYRRSRLGDQRWDLENYLMTADLEFWCRLILSGKTIVGTRRPPALAYRRHPSQATALLTANLDRFREESWALGVIADRAAARGWRSAAAVARARTVLQLHLLFLTGRDLAQGSIQRARQKLRLLQEVRQSARMSRKADVSH